jgi:hypothetical protein
MKQIYRRSVVLKILGMLHLTSLMDDSNSKHKRIHRFLVHQYRHCTSGKNAVHAQSTMSWGHIVKLHAARHTSLIFSAAKLQLVNNDTNNLTAVTRNINCA